MTHCWLHLRRHTYRRTHEEFDTAHPEHQHLHDETYKNVSYVRSECARLAEWLKGHA